MRKPLPVFRRALRESWRELLGWTIGIAAVLFLYLPLFPSIGGNGQMQQIIDSLPSELVNALGYDRIGTGAGYTQSTFYGLIGFLLLTIAATGWGADAIAGAEESGRLELDLAHGIGRPQYALESAAAILVRLAWLALFAAAVVLLLNEPSELGIQAERVVDATAALLGLTMLAGSIALFVGALTGRKRWAVMAGAGIAVLGYAFNAIANQVEEAEWLRVISPYAWAYHQPPLSDGADPVGLIALWGFTAIFIAASAAVLQQRDITG